MHQIKFTFVNEIITTDKFIQQIRIVFLLKSCTNVVYSEHDVTIAMNTNVNNWSISVFTLLPHETEKLSILWKVYVNC